MRVVIESPIKIPVGKKYFNLNMNEYRNKHFRILSKAKNNHFDVIKHQVRKIKPVDEPIKITFVLWKEGGRKRDVSNVCSVVDKFVCDALVKLNKIPDDCHEFIPQVEYLYGGIDRKNPRCDVIIESFN